ncbi:MAG: esterase [Chthoniobacteraceae bacterium]|nr:esterase [Chthoniobacteraceae bacterium]
MELTWRNAESIQRRGTILEGSEATRYDLAFIEFGEEGSYFDPPQLTVANQLIRSRKKPLLFVYLHGWHHNANPKDRDLAHFNQALRMLAGTMTERDVVGIYLGWRGEAIPIPVINSLLTYYTRKEAGERLANNYDCLNAIGSVVGTAHANHGRSIVVGHSFGGMVLERAIKSALTDPSPFNGNVILNDSLVVMLNPATESILSRQIVDTFNQRIGFDSRRNEYVIRAEAGKAAPRHYARFDQPSVVSITSQNDKATGMLFPAASWLWQITHPLRGRQQVNIPATEAQIAAGTQRQTGENGFFRHTPANESHLHNLTAAKTATLPQSSLSAFQENLRGKPVAGQLSFLTSAKGQKQSEGGSVETWNSAPSRTRWILRPENTAQTPYWLIQVPKEIINDHGGIWNDNSVALLAAIYGMKFPLGPGYSEMRTPAPQPQMSTLSVPASVTEAQLKK